MAVQVNAKQAKGIRKSLKHQGYDWRERDYFKKGSTVVCSGTCGRAHYLWVKQATQEYMRSTR